MLNPSPSPNQERPQVLLVGAGAVGQVYGHYFAKAGADVTFFTKEKYADEVRKGFRFYRIPAFRLFGKGELRDPESSDSFQVLTRNEEVSARRWDLVCLCMSSTGLRSGWFPEFARALGSEVTLVLFQPGLEDREYAAQYVPADRIVSGSVGFASYAAPLSGETVSAGPGTAYWLNSAAFSGPSERTNAVVALLRRSNFPAKRVADARAKAILVETIIGIVVTALPIVGWSFSGLARDRVLLRATSAAMHQALAVSERTFHVRAGAARRLIRPFFMRWALRIIPLFSPYLIEEFFRFHFTKIADQTAAKLETYARLAREHGLPADAIESLQARRLAAAPLTLLPQRKESDHKS